MREDQICHRAALLEKENSALRAQVIVMMVMVMVMIVMMVMVMIVRLFACMIEPWYRWEAFERN